MPLHPDFEKMKAAFVKRYGAKKGLEFFHRFLKKKNLDETKPMPKKNTKESKQCIIKGVELKEEGDTFHVGGFIGSTHQDEGDDIIPKETWEAWKDQMVLDVEARKSGEHHSEARGIYYGEADPNSLEIVELTDGQFGFWGDTNYDATDPQNKEVISKWQTGEFNSFSVTYDTDGSLDCDFDIKDDGTVVRIIGPTSKIAGYTATDIPMNENARVTDMGFKELKELYTHKTKLKTNGEVPKTMVEKKEDAQKEEGEDKKEEAIIPAKDAEKKPSESEEEKSEETTEEKPEDSEGKELVKEVKEAVLRSIIKELKENPKAAKKPMVNAGEKMIEEKELELKEAEFNKTAKEFKEKVLNNTASSSEQWRAISEFKETLKKYNMFDPKGIGHVEELSDSGMPFELKENEVMGKDWMGEEVRYPKGTFQKFEVKEKRLELKGIPTQITTDQDPAGAQTTFVAALANYEQTPARYNDLYTPFIINQLNDMTTTFNLLSKDNMANSAAIFFRVRRGRNSGTKTPGYGSEPTWATGSQLQKLNLHFVTSYIEISAEWEAIEFGRGAGGIDVFQTEIENGSLDFMDYINGLILGTGDGTLETAPLGFEHLIKTNGGGATTLYGKSRATFPKLDSGGYDNLSSAPFTLDQARKMVETVRVNGARREDLVYILSLRQKRLFYQLVQDMQRTVPTSSRIGFTGQMELDAIPFFEEKKLDDDSKTDDIYLIDTRHTRAGMKVAPTWVEMAQISLHRRGIIWMLWNLYCSAPDHNYWTYGAATS